MDIWVFDPEGHEIGMIGSAVSASFAVLAAEEMFASGCALLISVTSSGQITPQGAPPCFILIDRALRDEGTSYHYLPPSDWSAAPEWLLSRPDRAFDGDPHVLTGATWTTNAPFKETEPPLLRHRYVAFWLARWKRLRFMFCTGPGPGRHLSVPSDEPDWHHRGRLRERRGEWHR